MQVMNYYFNDMSDYEIDILVDICKNNNIHYEINKIKQEPNIISWLPISDNNIYSYNFIVKSDYEHFMFVKYMFNREQLKIIENEKNIQHLDKCYLKECEQQKIISSNLIPKKDRLLHTFIFKPIL